MNESKLRALVATAYTDGFFDHRELYLINQKAKELGIDNNALLDIIKNPKSENIYIPVTNDEKLGFIYDLMKIIYADEIVENAEKEIFYKYLEQLNFSDDIKDQLFDFTLESVKNKLSFDEFNSKIQ